MLLMSSFGIAKNGCVELECCLHQFLQYDILELFSRY